MNTVYLEFLVDKFVRDVQAAEQISSELPLFSKFKEIMSILQEKKIVPEMLIEIKGELQKINDLLVEVEDRRGKQKFHPTRTGKDLWNLYKTGRRLSTIRDKLKRVYGKPVNEEERQPKKAEVLVIEKKDLPGIYLPKYRGFDDQMVEIENLLSKNKGNVAIGRVGIYGSGKSALARKVIFSSNVEKLFELVLWIDLSEVIGSEETYECIKMGKTSSGNETSSGNDLHALLSSHLSPAKKCLVVLDGVSVALDGLKRVIGEILDNGSVIVTSTLPEVHKTLVPAKQKFHLHRIKGLQREDCWLIFQDIMKRKRLHNREGGLTIEMEEMKEEILDFCDGLPLGVKILAETISIQIARNYDWGIPEKLEIILGLDGDDLRSRKITHDQVAQTDEDGFIYIRIYLRGTDSVSQSMEEVGQICFPEFISVPPTS